MAEQTTIPTDEQYQEMKAQTVAYETAQAAQRLAERDAHLAPLRELVEGEAFAAVRAALTPELVARHATDADIDPHLRPLAGFMDRLRASAG